MGIGRGFPLPIAREHADIGDRQLLGQVAHDDRGDVGWVGEKGAEKPHGAQLDGKPQPLMAPAPALYQPQVGVIKVEVGVQELSDEFFTASYIIYDSRS